MMALVVARRRQVSRVSRVLGRFRRLLRTYLLRVCVCCRSINHKKSSSIAHLMSTARIFHDTAPLYSRRSRRVNQSQKVKSSIDTAPLYILHTNYEYECRYCCD